MTHLRLDKAEKSSLHKELIHLSVCQSWARNAHRFHIGKYKPKFEKWTWAERTNRHEDTLLANFRLGNPPLNKYLHKARIIQSPNCNWCPGLEEDTDHFFLSCRFFIQQRTSLFQKLRSLNVLVPTTTILLGGGGFSPHKGKAILDSTCAFLRETKRFKFI